jgi:hypothetical protein
MRKSILFAALLLLLSIRTLHAREIFLATIGVNTLSCGSVQNPCRNLVYVLEPANELVNDGDVLTLLAPAGQSIFDETEVRLRHRLTIRSAPQQRAHIRCPLTIEFGVCIQFDPESSGSRLERLEVSGGQLYALFFQTDWEQVGNPSGSGASNITVSDSVLHDSGRDVVKITPKCNDITIERSEIYRSGQIYPPGTPLDDKNAEGIDNVNGARMIVRDSHIYDIATTGLYFKGGAKDVLVERNVIERTGFAGVLIGFDTSPEFFDLTENPGYFEAVRGIVRNNIILDTDYSGIGLYASKDAQVLNNTIMRAAKIGHAALYFGVTLQDFDPLALRPANLNPRIRNNLISVLNKPCVAIRYANDLGGLSGLSGAPGMNFQGFQNMSGTCRFIDARPGSPLSAGGSLAQWRAATNADAQSLEASFALSNVGRIGAASLAINAGVTLAEITDDIDRQSRVGNPDLGADEYFEVTLFANGFE